MAGCRTVGDLPRLEAAILAARKLGAQGLHPDTYKSVEGEGGWGTAREGECVRSLCRWQFYGVKWQGAVGRWLVRAAFPGLTLIYSDLHAPCQQGCLGPTHAAGGCLAGAVHPGRRAARAAQVGAAGGRGCRYGVRGLKTAFCCCHWCHHFLLQGAGRQWLSWAPLTLQLRKWLCCRPDPPPWSLLPPLLQWSALWRRPAAAATCCKLSASARGRRCTAGAPPPLPRPS